MPERIVATQKKQLILTIVMIVGMAALFFIILRKAPENVGEQLYEYRINQLERSIQARDSMIKGLLIDKKRSDSAVMDALSRISNIQGQISALRNNKTIIIKEIDETPNTIRNYNRDQLRESFTNPKD